VASPSQPAHFIGSLGIGRPQTTHGPELPAALDSDLVERGIELLALSFVDNAGISRAKCIPSERAAAATSRGVGSPHAFSIFTGNDAMATATGAEATGDLRLVPDWSGLAGGVDGWGWVPVDIVTQEAEPWPFCTRTFLGRMTARAAGDGYGLRMAYEVEWYAERAGDCAPAHGGPAYSQPAAAEAGPYLREVARRLAAHGIEVEQLHPEYSPGQVEFSVAARDPVTAADQAVLLRHVVRSARWATGYRSSFAPVARAGLLGNGSHLHFSLWRGETNLFGSDRSDPVGLTREARAFLAGVLRELPALVALGSACPISFLRRGPGRWTGAFVCWGTENREAPLRLIRGTRAARPTAANVEFKALDCSGNPYLVAGAVIAAGLAGLEGSAELPEPVAVEPSRIDEAERDERGIAALPQSLGEGADALERSGVLRAALGDELHAAIVAVRRAEAEFGRSLSEAELYDYYRWRY
jgi:glutamine synthetase